MLPKTIGTIAKLLNTLFHSTFSGETTEIADANKKEDDGCNFQRETMFCLSCPFNGVALNEIKYHTLSQHPVGPAAVRNNSVELSYLASDVTFFCIKEKCNYYTTKCNFYEEHLMSCCALLGSLSDKETERLRASLHFILDFEQKHYLNTFCRFLDFVSNFHEAACLNSLEGTFESDSVISSVDRVESEKFLEENSWACSASVITQKESSSSEPLDMRSNQRQVVHCDENVTDIENENNAAGTVESKVSESPVSKSDKMDDGHKLEMPQKKTVREDFMKIHYNFVSQDDAQMSCEHIPAETLDMPSQNSGQGSKVTGRDDNLNDAFTCPFCQLMFCSTDFLECHVKERHKDNDIKAVDGQKNIVTSENAEMMPFRNLRERSSSRKYGRDVSSEISTRSLKLKHDNQQKPVQSGTGGKSFQCEECSKCFKFRSLLNNHLKTHTGEKPFSCKECGARFTRKYDLQRHFSRHTAENKRRSSEAGSSVGTTYPLHDDVETSSDSERPFRCPEPACDKGFKSKKVLKAHLRTHTGEKPFKCNYCGKRYTRNYDLFRHVQVAHKGDNSFQCDESNTETFEDDGDSIQTLEKTDHGFQSPDKADDSFQTPEKTVDVFQSIVKTDSKEKPYKCNQCGKSCGRKHDLIRHIRTHTKSFRCQVCGQHFTCYSRFSEHMRWHSGHRPYICNLCGKPFARKCDLQRHNLIHNKGKFFKCTACEESFHKSADLRKHIEKHAVGDKFICNECGKSFTPYAALRKHMTTHVKEKLHTCDQCGKSFKDKWALYKHMKIHSERKLHACSVCHRGFVTNGSLKQHMRTHTGEKPYLCSMCGKSFSLKQNLRSHIRTHTGEKPFGCNLCEKAFSERGTLNMHMRIHTGERPFKCKHCGKGFINTSGLHNHERQHLSEKPFKCDYCGKGFIKNIVLVMHMRTHTGERPYKCNKCGLTFTGATYLSKHERSYHRAKRESTEQNFML